MCLELEIPNTMDGMKFAINSLILPTIQLITSDKVLIETIECKLENINQQKFLEIKKSFHLYMKHFNVK